jgi:hypothetical protein
VVIGQAFKGKKIRAAAKEKTLIGLLLSKEITVESGGIGAGMWTENQKQKMELLRGRFIEYLTAVNYSPATLVNYDRDAQVFLDYHIPHINLHDFLPRPLPHILHINA